MLHSFVFAFGSSWAFHGAYLMALENPYGIYDCGWGVLIATPPLVVFALGRDYVFNLMARRFDRDPKRAQRDGAFIAAVLDNSMEVCEGDIWWTHRDTPDLRYGENETRRNWREGRVVNLREDDFAVLPLPDSQSGASRNARHSLSTGASSDKGSIISASTTSSVFDRQSIDAGSDSRSRSGSYMSKVRVRGGRTGSVSSNMSSVISKVSGTSSKVSGTSSSSEAPHGHNKPPRTNSNPSSTQREKDKVRRAGWGSKKRSGLGRDDDGSGHRGSTSWVLVKRMWGSKRVSQGKRGQVHPGSPVTPTKRDTPTKHEQHGAPTSLTAANLAAHTAATHAAVTDSSLSGGDSGGASGGASGDASGGASGGAASTAGDYEPGFDPSKRQPDLPGGRLSEISMDPSSRRQTDGRASKKWEMESYRTVGTIGSDAPSTAPGSSPGTGSSSLLERRQLQLRVPDGDGDGSGAGRFGVKTMPLSPSGSLQSLNVDTAAARQADKSEPPSPGTVTGASSPHTPPTPSTPDSKTPRGDWKAPRGGRKSRGKGGARTPKRFTKKRATDIKRSSMHAPKSSDIAGGGNAASRARGVTSNPGVLRAEVEAAKDGLTSSAGPGTGIEGLHTLGSGKAVNYPMEPDVQRSVTVGGAVGRPDRTPDPRHAKPTARRGSQGIFGVGGLVSRNQRRRSWINPNIGAAEAGLGAPGSGQVDADGHTGIAVSAPPMDGRRDSVNARRPSLIPSLGPPQSGTPGSGSIGAPGQTHSMLDGIIIWVPKSRRNIPSAQLLEIARTTLRCVEAKDLTLDIMFKTAPPGTNNTTVSPGGMTTTAKEQSPPPGIITSGEEQTGLLDVITSGKEQLLQLTQSSTPAAASAKGAAEGGGPLKFKIGDTGGIVADNQGAGVNTPAAAAAEGSEAPEAPIVRSVSVKDPYSLSRPVAPGESIDFFVSHSWHDDAQLKHTQLRLLVDAFKRRHGREPTFWFDKTCIDQANIADGLKVLPINVMACNKMLILCGPTYADRLWCVWELCTIFSFMRQDLAMERVMLVPMNSPDCNVMEKLSNFSIANAHCYDPNEENRLRKVISAVGEARFVKQVRDLATAMASQAAEASAKPRNSSHIFSPGNSSHIFGPGNSSHGVIQSMTSMTSSITHAYSGGQLSVTGPLKKAGGYFGKTSSS